MVAWLAVALLAGPAARPEPPQTPDIDVTTVADGPTTDASPNDIDVVILSRLSIRSTTVDRIARLEAQGDHLQMSGPSGVLPIDRWSGNSSHYWITVGNQPRREYPGGLTIRAADNGLRFILRMHLEDYVAAVVASETTPGTARAALEAQAIVVRSYAKGSPNRHADAKFCDLAHCQWLRASAIDPAHLAATRDATAATAGKVLRLADGSVAATPFHAACGGHTGDPLEVFGAPDHTGAAAVDDPGCPLDPWQTEVSPGDFARVLRRVFLQASGRIPLTSIPEELHLVAGRGGYVAQVIEPGGAVASGDALARGLDQAGGYGRVRSARFTIWTGHDGQVSLRGSGLGHGVGLCQAGAARLALQGQTAEAILAHYFPKAHLSE